ncbi:inositol monophosphatase family protein [Nonomuraea sp. NPDC059007]|uniref:inositol monophosphatase family protein n=1 Tax=Nonomuraea sp. NPDC059007 TaxID=3346692 RepID=UPI003695552F
MEPAGLRTAERARFALAWRCLDSADALSARAFREGAYEVSIKSDHSPMLDLEVRIERAIEASIRRAFPGDAVVGEELGGTAEEASLWVIDPIDGTSNFVEGLPAYAHMICYVRRARPRFSLVSAPLLGRRWWAVSGAGAFESGRRLTVSSVDRLEGARIAYGGLRDYGPDTQGMVRLITACARSRGFGNFLPHMLVAEGTYDIASSGAGGAVWDVVPLDLIVSEAGGRLTSLTGGLWSDGEAVVTSNGLLHTAALRKVGAVTQGPVVLRGASTGTPNPGPRSGPRTAPPAAASE